MTLLFPLHYLKLENAYGKYAIRRDTFPWLLLTVTLAAPFIILDESNYFHKDGFLDKIGSFSAVLTGFYVAALIAVATLSSKFADLDVPITEGEIRAPSKDNRRGEPLSRRQYVCYMFGYLAFVSLILSLLSLVTVALSPLVGAKDLAVEDGFVSADLIRSTGIVGISIAVASLCITTIRGLYYLIERLYAEAPRIDNSRTPEDSETPD